MFCATADVQTELGSPPGAAWSDGDIADAISSATEVIKANLLTGSVSQTQIAAWENGTEDVPKFLTSICAWMSASIVLVRKAGQSSVGDSKAAGLFKQANSNLQQFVKGISVLVDSSGAAISSATQKVAVSTDGRTPTFSIGDAELGETGTLDNY